MPDKATLLLVEDNPVVRECVRDILSKKFNLLEAETRKRGISILMENITSIDLIILDLNLPDSRGADTVSVMCKQFPEIPVLVMTEEQDPHLAAQVIKKGAADYLLKNRIYDDAACLEEMIGELIRQGEEKRMEKPLSIFFPQDEAYGKLIKMGEMALRESLPLHIKGESGVGKSNLVRYLHNRIMPHSPLVEVDCGAVPGSLIESELFGYKKGAFTGALQDKAGKIEEADKGILFLDEITNASADLQMRLLHVLQNKCVTRIGDSKERKVDFALVTATNRDISVEIREQRFRGDLYFRIKAVEIALPPLRSSLKVLKQYIGYFLKLFRKQFGTSYTPGKSLYSELLTRSWDGNIRELEMEIRKLVCFHSYGISPDEECAVKEQALSYRDLLLEREKSEILNALEATCFNVSRAAEVLKIPRTTLHSKMKKMDIEIRKTDT